jgi:cytochrome c oxidase subunit 4
MSTRQPASLKTYFYTWVGLMLMLLATVGSSYMPLGLFNSILNLFIATMKALLVAIFFMHLRSASMLMRIFSVVALFTLALLVGLSSSDYATRQIHSAPWSPPPPYYDNH